MTLARRICNARYRRHDGVLSTKKVLIGFRCYDTGMAATTYNNNFNNNNNLIAFNLIAFIGSNLKPERQGVSQESSTQTHLLYPPYKYK